MLKNNNSDSDFFGFAGKYFWILSAGLVVALNYVSSAFPMWVESFYSRQFFPFVRLVFDHLLGWLPFPAVYLWIGFLLFMVILLIRNFPGFPLGEKMSSWLIFGRQILSFVSIFLIGFYLLWGFNYRRQPIEQLLGMQPEPLGPDQLCEALERETQIIASLRSKMDTIMVPEGLEDTLREMLYSWSISNRLPVSGMVRTYKIYPKGIFLRFSSSGLYFPFSGQGQVDAGLHPLDLPYVMTHEMAHGLGYGDEGTCNFMAYVSTTSSNNSFIKYAGHLSYWRTLAASYLPYRPDDFKRISEQLPDASLEDIRAIYAVLDKYPDIMPKLRNSLYDSYLQMQGISEGIKNYNRVILLVHAWQEIESSVN